jgi:hypothetical protein
MNYFSLVFSYEMGGVVKKNTFPTIPSSRRMGTLNQKRFRVGVVEEVLQPFAR